jgi:hypothetical protein
MIQFSDLQGLIRGQRGQAYELYEIAVRGALTTGYVNPDGLYDSVFFVVDQSKETFSTWLGSTDPSSALIANPINPAGAAQLQEGVWLFQRGIHKENPAWPCLIQAEDFVVNRLDINGNVKGTEKGDFGIHQHSGGEGQSTNRFSAGCLIYHNGFGYMCDPTRNAFVQATNGRMIAIDQGILPVQLMRGSDTGLDFSGITFANPITA